MKKTASFSMDSEIVNRLDKVAKKLKQTKSSIIEEMLESLLPVLEQTTPNKMVASAMKEMAKSIDLTADLFSMEYDKSVEDYKKMKKG